MGAGRKAMSQEMPSPITWVRKDGDIRTFRHLILPGFSANLLKQDVLGQMDAVITTDHLAFYEQGVIRKTPDTWIHLQK